MIGESSRSGRQVSVLHVVESLEVGGLENVVLSLAQTQKEQGHRVEINCIWRVGELGHRAAANGIEVICCHKQPGLDLSALMQLRANIRAFCPDVIHTHNGMANYFAAVASLNAITIPLINTRHGMGPKQMNGRGEWLYRLSLRRTQSVVFVCEAARRRFTAIGAVPAAKAHVVRNGIDLTRFAQSALIDECNLKSRLGLTPGTHLFGTVGRLNPAKNQTLMIKAMKLLLQAGLQADLVIVGDGPLKQELQRTAQALGVEQRVHLLGNRTDVPSILSGLDTFVLSSVTEGYSLALVEAAASGLPIIATDVGGNGEIVQPGCTGWLVPQGDANALATAMHCAAVDEPLRCQFAREAARWAREHGSLSLMAVAYERLYQLTPSQSVDCAAPSAS